MTDVRKQMARAIGEICNEKSQELASKVGSQAPPIPWQAFEREAQAAITAYEKALKAEGLVIVPLKATDFMMETGLDVYGHNPDMPDEEVEHIWQAMAGAALMPTEVEWEGMGRKVDMAERKSIRAEADDILKTPAGQLIAREAFKEGIEAAAERIEHYRDVCTRSAGKGTESGAYNIAATVVRDLRKP